MIQSSLIDELAKATPDTVLNTFVELPLFSSTVDYEAVVELLVMLALSADVVEKPQLLSIIDTLAVKAAKNARNMETSEYVC